MLRAACPMTHVFLSGRTGGGDREWFGRGDATLVPGLPEVAEVQQVVGVAADEVVRRAAEQGLGPGVHGDDGAVVVHHVHTGVHEAGQRVR